jgi:hypothetical protein
MVDYIPSLTYVPSWVPGTGWKKIANYYREMGLLSRVTPFKLVQNLYVSVSLLGIGLMRRPSPERFQYRNKERLRHAYLPA